MTHTRSDGNTILKDEARTPASLFTLINAHYHPNTDLFTNGAENSCCVDYYHRTDSNNLGFLHPDIHLLPHDVGYANPPYSHPFPFIQKCYIETLTIPHTRIIMLLPADTSTKWFHQYCMKASEIVFLEGRITFHNPNGTRMTGTPQFGNMLVVFDGDSGGTNPKMSSMKWKEDKV